MPIRQLTLIQILAFAALGVGPAGADPQVFILHGPIQPATSQPVTYSATAHDPTGLVSIVISEEVRRLTLCSGLKCSILISTTDLRTCAFNPPSPNRETCSVTVGSGYPNASHVGYRVNATNVSGATVSEGWVYFAAGAYPWPDDPIPIYVRGDPSEKIDLVFIPDTDYGLNNAGFMNDVTALIRESFLSEAPFAQHIRANRDMWNLYLTYRQGNAEPFCGQLPPPNWTILRATVDSGFIVHRTPFSDCSGIGEGSLFSAEPVLPSTDQNYLRSRVVPVHEVGHSVFSLADEYPGGGFFESTLPEHNVFRSRQICWNNAVAHGWPRGDCKRIQSSQWYRSDGVGDVMEDTSTTSNAPGRSDAGRHGWKYGQCRNGNC